MGHATVYEHEPRNIGLKSEPSRLDTKPCFTDWLLQNVRKILDTTVLHAVPRGKAKEVALRVLNSAVNFLLDLDIKSLL